jgi:chemotaxis receptor (MCP) glutamine deamidase CheD
VELLQPTSVAVNKTKADPAKYARNMIQLPIRGIHKMGLQQKRRHAMGNGFLFLMTRQLSSLFQTKGEVFLPGC